MKKIFVSMGALLVAAATVPLFAAFEAHVINVTAKIENALRMDVTPIEYGTVFPQEELDKFVDVALSQSFLDENRVDDVEYVVRQKPKCGLPVSGTDPVQYSAYAQVSEDANGNFVCPQGYVALPLLCPYLSKFEESTDGTGGAENDSRGIPAFHGAPIDLWNLNTTLATQVRGRLAKSEQDISDRWKIDLKAPCFEGNCDQGWAEYVRAINPGVDPLAYIQPRKNEHQLFGCDLWFEVGGISLPGIGCNEKADVALVLDRSGSISSDELATLKNAAKSFVTALNPTSAGVHLGEVSFSNTATLDIHLTDSAATLNTAIDALAAGGLTNLEDAILDAQVELENPGDGHDREDVGSPDFMVIITDGAPTESNTGGDHAANAAAQAAFAKAAGIEIFVVGVGTTTDTANYLKTSIASGADHYFDAADFDDLEAILDDIASCNQ